MLPRRLRLPRRGFTPTGPMKRATSAHFSMSYSETADIPGMAVVVSKKVARSSVGRHLIKRRIMSLLKPYTRPNRALVVHARSGIEKMSFTELKDELTTLLTSLPSARVTE